MNEKEIKEYLLQKGSTSVPELQVKFALSYKDARLFLGELQNEHFGRFDTGVLFVYNAKEKNDPDRFFYEGTPLTKKRRRELLELKKVLIGKPMLYKKVVLYCVEKQDASIFSLIQDFGMEYSRAKEIIEWLQKVKILSEPGSSERRVLLSMSEFQFMLQADEGSERDENENDEESALEHKRVLLEARRSSILRLMEEALSAKSKGEDNGKSGDSGDDAGKFEVERYDADEEEREEVDEEDENAVEEENKHEDEDDEDSEEDFPFFSEIMDDELNEKSEYQDLECIRGPISCWDVKTSKQFVFEELVEEISALFEKSTKTYGVIRHAKGAVQGEGDEWYRFDITPSQHVLDIIDAKEVELSYETGRLQVIGFCLQESKIAELFGV